MQNFIINLFQDFPEWLATFLIAVVPVTELRASIPLAVKEFGLSPLEGWFWSVAGTFFGMTLILFFLDPVAKFLSKHFNFFDRFFRWLFAHTRRKNGRKMEKYQEWAVFLLAAIPIPLLGGMTGALTAFVFGVAWRKALPLLLLGTMVAGGMVLGITVYF